MTPTFEWPIPPHCRLVRSPDELARRSEASLAACVISLRDGHSLTGRLLQFDPEGGSLDFIPKRSQAARHLMLAEVQSLRLTDMIELARLPLPMATEGGGEAQLEQKCTVNFINGAPLTIDTMGCVSRDYGLFLYLAVSRNQALRFFVPASAMQSFHLGEPIGQMLLKENAIPTAALDAGLEKQEQLRSLKLGDYLAQQNIVSKEQIEAALARQKSLPPLRLGDALIQENLISEGQLKEALERQQQDRKRQLGDLLVEMKAVSLEDVKRVLAQKLGIPFVRLGEFDVDPNALKAVPAALVQKHNVIPLFQSDGRIVVALENPMDFNLLQELAFTTKQKVDPVMASG
ncbi:MAG: hypothetical protein JO002_06045, partial [Burkholderiaceae bacterium]|nr:hypothetical protein [Burkholderiaceae bacterium]